MNAPINQQHSTGYRLLHNPRLNKGTAFTEAERRKYGLEGLLPPAVTNIDLQIARRHATERTRSNDCPHECGAVAVAIGCEDPVWRVCSV